MCFIFGRNLTKNSWLVFSSLPVLNAILLKLLALQGCRNDFTLLFYAAVYLIYKVICSNKYLCSLIIMPHCVCCFPRPALLLMPLAAQLLSFLSNSEQGSVRLLGFPLLKQFDFFLVVLRVTIVLTQSRTWGFYLACCSTPFTPGCSR